MDDPQIALIARLMDVAVQRGQVHAGNLANQNTPGYRAKAVAFEDAFQAALARGDTTAALSTTPVVYEPRDTGVDNDGNDVAVDREVTLMAQNQTMYNTYVAMLRGKRSLMMLAASNSP